MGSSCGVIRAGFGLLAARLMAAPVFPSNAVLIHYSVEPKHAGPETTALAQRIEIATLLRLRCELQLIDD
jgi:hypothetical protein